MSIADFVKPHRLQRRSVPMAAPEILHKPVVRWPAKARVRRGEILRKLIHVSPGLLPFALMTLPHAHPLPTYQLRNVALLATVLTLTYIALKNIVKRPGERNFYATCFSYPGCILATLFLFPQHPEFACVVVAVLAFGDGSAFIGGKLFGGRRLPWNPKKTWAGMVSFIAVASPMATIAYFVEANVMSLATWGDGRPFAVPLAMAALCGTIATLTASLAESWPTKVTDNLRVGIAAATSVIVVHYLCAGWFLA